MVDGKAPVWTRMRRVYREKGLGGVWFGGLSLVGYRRLVLMERRLDEPVPEISPRVDVEIRPLGREDEAAFAALGQGDADVFRDRLARGHECWGAWCSGSLRHVSWVAFGEAWVEYLRCRLLLDDGVGYRGSKFMKAMQKQGRTALLAAILPDNPGAFAPWLKMGLRRIGVVRAIGAGPRPRIFVRLDRAAAAPLRWRFERAGWQEPS
jgi:hypothetical protein